MKVLLTGPNSYIGRYLLRNLLEDGHTVIATSSNPYRLKENLNTYPEWLQELFANRNLILEKAEFSDSATHTPVFWENLLETHQIEGVLNNAGLYVEQGNSTFESVNFNAVKGLSDAIAQNNRVQRFIHFSTITAGYEHAKQNPNTYAGSKRKAEDYIQDTPDVWSKTTIIRPITVYDPTAEERPGHIAYLALLSPMPILGSGKQRLQPIHVEDVAKTTNLIMDGGMSVARILEAVGPEIITIEDWRRTIKKARGESYNPIHVPYNIAETIVRHPTLQIGSINPTMVGVWKSREDGHYQEHDHRPFASAVGIEMLRKIGDSYPPEMIFKGPPGIELLALLSDQQADVEAAAVELSRVPEGKVYAQILRDLAAGKPIDPELLSSLQNGGPSI